MPDERSAVTPGVPGDVPGPLRPRDATIEGLRVAAVAAVMLIHSAAAFGGGATTAATALAALSRWAVPLFFGVSGLLAARSRDRTGPAPLGDQIAKWARRLLLPYALWTLVYLGVRMLGSHGLQLGASGIVGIVGFGQASWHLWFLPALFLSHLVGAACRTRRATVIAVAVSLPFLLIRDFVPPTAGLAYTAFAFGAPGWVSTYLVGLLIGQNKVQPLSPWTVRAGALGLMGVALGIALATAAGTGSGPVPYFIATLAAILTIADAASGGDAFGARHLSGAGRLAFGAYLAHMLPVIALSRVHLPSSAQPLGLIGFSSVVIAVSFGVAAALYAIPRLRFLTGS